MIIMYTIIMDGLKKYAITAQSWFLQHIVSWFMKFMIKYKFLHYVTFVNYFYFKTFARCAHVCIHVVPCLFCQILCLGRSLSATCCEFFFPTSFVWCFVVVKVKVPRNLRLVRITAKVWVRKVFFRRQACNVMDMTNHSAKTCDIARCFNCPKWRGTSVKSLIKCLVRPVFYIFSTS